MNQPIIGVARGGQRGHLPPPPKPGRILISDGFTAVLGVTRIPLSKKPRCETFIIPYLILKQHQYYVHAQ